MEPVRLEALLLRPGARLPARHSALASGFDLYACLDGGTLEVTTSPIRVPTGVAIASPAGSDVQIRPRSGLTARGVIAAFGTIDADYRGELLVTMYCLPDTGSYVIEDGERIAQLVVSSLVPIEWVTVTTLEETARGGQGHGSTGR